MPRPKDKPFAAYIADHGDPWSYPGPLSDAVVSALAPPATGRANYRIKYCPELGGFGARVTAKGAKSFVLNYRTLHQRERRITIGSFPEWSVTQARSQAAALRRRIDIGEDPMAERHSAREAPLVRELIERFDAEHITRKRPGTQAEYRRPLQRHVGPSLGLIPVADVTHTDIERLHSRIARTAPSAANRAVAVLSKMFTLAVKWGCGQTIPRAGSNVSRSIPANVI